MSFFRTLISENSRTILDLGCATGDLIFFAESLGMAPVGIDNDSDLLRIAERKKRRKGSTAEFINSDMRKAGELFKPGRFDIITCMGNTLAHLGSSSDITEFLNSIFELLADGGVFCGQMVNYDRLDSESPVFFNEIENSHFKFIRTNRFLKQDGKVEFRGELMVKGKGTSHVNVIELFPAGKEFLEKELKRSGFHSIRFYGSFDLGKYGKKSNALIFRAEK